MPDMEDILCIKKWREAKRLKMEVERLRYALAYSLREQEALRRVSESRVKSAEERGRESVLKEVFVLLEDVDRLLGVLAGEDVPENVRRGAESIMRKVSHTLKVMGVEKITPKIGEDFDPSVMEALSVVKVEGMERGKVAAVYEPGWKYMGRLLKPARVGVAG